MKKLGIWLDVAFALWFVAYGIMLWTGVAETNAFVGGLMSIVVASLHARGECWHELIDKGWDR